VISEYNSLGIHVLFANACCILWILPHGRLFTCLLIGEDTHSVMNYVNCNLFIYLLRKRMGRESDTLAISLLASKIYIPTRMRYKSTCVQLHVISTATLSLYNHQKNIPSPYPSKQTNTICS